MEKARSSYRFGRPRNLVSIFGWCKRYVCVVQSVQMLLLQNVYRRLFSLGYSGEKARLNSCLVLLELLRVNCRWQAMTHAFHSI